MFSHTIGGDEMQHILAFRFVIIKFANIAGQWREQWLAVIDKTFAIRNAKSCDCQRDHYIFIFLREKDY